MYKDFVNLIGQSVGNVSNQNESQIEGMSVHGILSPHLQQHIINVDRAFSSKVVASAFEKHMNEGKNE